MTKSVSVTFALTFDDDDNAVDMRIDFGERDSEESDSRLALIAIMVKLYTILSSEVRNRSGELAAAKFRMMILSLITIEHKEISG